MKVIKNNANITLETPITPKVLQICCNSCDSELQITKDDTHIGWLGAKYITCPCCGEESMVNELDGIKLTIDNIKFPQHFLRTTSGMRDVVDIGDAEIVEEIKRGVRYLREDKDNWFWYSSHGNLSLMVIKYSGDEEYSIVLSKDFYHTYIPFEEEDYN